MVKALGGVRMIFNMNDDPTLKEDIDKLNSEVSKHKDEIANLRFNQSSTHADMLILSKELNSYEMLLGDLSTRLNDINYRVTSLETNMHKWTSVGVYIDGSEGQYITPPIPLSECGEVMLILKYDLKVVGSFTLDMNTFKNSPFVASVRDGSTTRSATIQDLHDGRIYIHDISNLSYIHINVR